MSMDTRPLWESIAAWLPVFHEAGELGSLVWCIGDLYVWESITYEEMLALNKDLRREIVKHETTLYEHLRNPDELEPMVRWCLKMARRSKR